MVTCQCILLSSHTSTFTFLHEIFYYFDIDECEDIINACLMDFRFRNLIGSHEFILMMIPSQATIFLLSNQDDVIGRFCYTIIVSHQLFNNANVGYLTLRLSPSDSWKWPAKKPASLIIIINYYVFCSQPGIYMNQTMIDHREDPFCDGTAVRNE